MQRRSRLLPFAVLGSVAAAGTAGAQAPAENVPLKQVVLFSSGVGYFERSARVTGDATVSLSFRTNQINDILKSLVLFDPQGTVRPVTYTTRDAHLRRLGSVGQGIDGSITLGALLRRFQGARVRLETGAEGVEGRIVSVNLKVQAVKEGGVLQTEVMNVLTEGGLQAVSLEQVSRVKLLDERLDRELRESLEALATGLDDQRKSVELRFTGNAAREVRAAYLQEMPVWKTSYRLVLSDREKPYLQGWAQVENTTDEDWKDVRLGLVSGRPVSFIQELYQPLYIPRPTVQAQLVGSPIPQTYGEVLEGEGKRAPGAGGFGGFAGGMGGGFGFGGLGGGLPSPESEPKISLQLRGVRLREAVRRIFEGSGQNYSVDPNIADVPVDLIVRDLTRAQALRLVIRQAASSIPGLTSSKEGDVYVLKLRTNNPMAGVGGAVEDQGPPPEFVEEPGFRMPSQAQGEERGELFEYAIKQPVTLARGQAAMVPIVSDAVEGERLSIFDGDAETRHALHGLRLKNTTGLHLAGGPVTVFRSGTYAGDAQVGHLRPGEDRLLSYAVDLELVAGVDERAPTYETVAVGLREGSLWVNRRQRVERVYTFRNKTDQPKRVLVLQQIDPVLKLVAPAKPAEKTADQYRFQVEVPAGKTSELRVVGENVTWESVSALTGGETFLQAYALNGQIDEKVRAALKQVLERRRKVSELQARVRALTDEIKSIDGEQDRIRRNMGQLDRNSPLYQQYVKKLTDQETRIETLRADIAKLNEEISAAQRELSEFVKGLNVGEPPSKG